MPFSWAYLDSNQGPLTYKISALTAELYARCSRGGSRTRDLSVMNAALLPTELPCHIFKKVSINSYDLSDVTSERSYQLRFRLKSDESRNSIYRIIGKLPCQLPCQSYTIIPKNPLRYSSVIKNRHFFTQTIRYTLDMYITLSQNNKNPLCKEGFCCFVAEPGVEPGL